MAGIMLSIRILSNNDESIDREKENSGDMRGDFLI